MKGFAELYRRLDSTRRTNARLEALRDHFRAVDPADGAWALHYLLGRRGRRVVGSRQMRAWVAKHGGQPEWLVDECYDAVGDLAETVALLAPGRGDEGEAHGLSLAEVIEERVLALRDLDDAAREELVVATWRRFDLLERLLYVKLITGGFRVGVSRGLVARALAELAGTDQATMAHRLAGRWEPEPAAFVRLMAGDAAGDDPLRPYPFFLASPVPESVSDLGAARDFVAEWKWDGIRVQAVRRGEGHLLWSRGEDVIDAAFPEISAAIAELPPGTVLDGELLAWRDGAPLPFHSLQRRLQRKSVGAKLRQDVPVRMIAYDLLEFGGQDWRERPLEQRQARLREVLEALGRPEVAVAEVVDAERWEALAELRAESRARGVEGLMLKRRGSPYRAGRTRGDWWKWKVEPFTVDAVLVYAQRGHGRRASLYTDYTFAVHGDDGELVPVAKAYSGLSDAEIRKVDAFVRRNITERFGPVRAVTPELVFELAFEGIQPSPRHKAGLALRFPRMARWRHDKTVAEADSLASLRELLAREAGAR